jgi:hypothetical protein
MGIASQRIDRARFILDDPSTPLERLIPMRRISNPASQWFYAIVGNNFDFVSPENLIACHCSLPHFFLVKATA